MYEKKAKLHPVLRALISADVVNSLSFILLLIFITGHIMWAAERKSNSGMFPSGYLDGIDDGIWCEFAVLNTKSQI